MGIREWLTRRTRARRTREADLDRELRAHLDLETEDQAARGLAPGAASRAARHALGNVALVMEDTRSAWAWTSADRLFQDVRFGLRLMRRSPVFTGVAVLSLALGIGANTAIFSVINAVMLRPLPVADPAGLVRPVIESGDPTTFPYWNYPQFTQFRDQLEMFSSVAAVSDLDRANVEISGAGGNPGPVHMTMVSGTYFSVMGLAAQVGRTFTAEDDRVPGGHPVAMISDDFWRRRLGRASDVLGRTLTLSDTTYTILGVAPAGFTGDWVGHPTEVWVPTAMQAQVMIERPGLLANPGPSWVRVVARMRPGTTRPAAEAAANAWFRAGLAAPSASPRPLSPREVQQIARSRLVLEPAGRGFSTERQSLSAPLTIVMVVVGVVLLIACANVANLLLARAEARRTEMAVRLALGAARARLWRQVLTESVLLATLAGSLGVAIAVSATRALSRIIQSGETALWLDLHLDARVLSFTTLVSLAAGLLFGIAPAFTVSGGSPALALAGRSDTGTGTRSGFRVGKMLIVAQVALSLVLLVGATSFVRTLRNLRTQELGFDRSHALLVQASPEQEGLRGAPVADLMTRLQDRLISLPGVRSVAASSTSVLGGMGGGSPAIVPGYVYGPNEDNWIRWNIVTPRYFDAMGMPFVAGRDLAAGDVASAPRVAVINATMARYYWHTTDVVGRRFGIRRDTGNEIEIVGVVNDAQIESLRDRAERTVYLPYQQDVSHLGPFTVVVRAAGSPDALVPMVREVLGAVDPRLPVLSIRSVDDQIDSALVVERLVAILSGLFGALALLLTCLGLYGVMSYLAARRRNEIGVRLALGATRPGVIGLVLGGSLRLLAFGIALGVPAALLTMRAASTTLFRVNPADAATMAAMATILLAVGTLASAVPAYRATNVNPVAALRSE